MFGVWVCTSSSRVRDEVEEEHVCAYNGTMCLGSAIECERVWGRVRKPSRGSRDHKHANTECDECSADYSSERHGDRHCARGKYGAHYHAQAIATASEAAAWWWQGPAWDATAPRFRKLGDADESVTLPSPRTARTGAAYFAKGVFSVAGAAASSSAGFGVSLGLFFA